MHIHPSILLLMGLFYIFAPLFEKFLSGAGITLWYAPHLIWGLVILISWLATRGEGEDET